MNKQKIKYLIVVLIIGLAGFGVYRYTDYLDEVSLPGLVQRKGEEAEEEPDLNLAEDWQEEEGSEGAVVKLSKDSENEIATNIILNKEEEIEYDDPETYTDQLIAGTKSALPSLVYTQDETENNDYFIRQLTGSYWQAGSRIGISQRIYLKNDTAYVITASYDYQIGQELEEEINQNFDLLEENYIQP